MTGDVGLPSSILCAQTPGQNLRLGIAKRSRESMATTTGVRSLGERDAHMRLECLSPPSSLCKAVAVRVGGKKGKCPEQRTRVDGDA